MIQARSDAARYAHRADVHIGSRAVGQRRHGCGVAATSRGKWRRALWTDPCGIAVQARKPDPVVAVVPKSAMMDKGIAIVVDRLADAAKAQPI